MALDEKGIFADTLTVDSVIRPEKTPEEELSENLRASEDRALRPQCLDDYIGQTEVKEQLSIALKAAKLRGDALDHVLIFGPPGLGKTTLSNIIANELSVGISQTSGPALEKKGDAAALLTNLQPRNVIFIDEIHRLSPVIEEFLYPAMEDYMVDIMTGEGPSARSIKISLNPFTLIGATTRAGTLTSPLRARFGIILQLKFYAPEELNIIIRSSARKLNVEITEDASMEIASRSRGTPRIANRLLRRVRDYAQVKGNGVITLELARAALSMLRIDEDGFDDFDRQYLRCIIEDFNVWWSLILSSRAMFSAQEQEELLQRKLMQSSDCRKDLNLMSAKTFSINARVYYEDTDAGGIVYYANYLKFCERARTDWLRGMGLSQSSMLEDKKGFVIKNIKGNYISSARLDDMLRITCIPTKARFASLKIFQQVYNQHDELLFEFECSIAFVDMAKHKPATMPKEAIEYIKQFVPEDVSHLEVKI